MEGKESARLFIHRCRLINSMPSHVRKRSRWVLGSLALIVLALTAAGAWSVWPRFFADPIDQGQQAYEAGDYAQAGELAREQLRADRDDSGALRLLARIAARRDDHETSQRLFKRIGPEAMEAEDFFLLALGLLEQGETELAWGALDLAESKDADHPETLFQIARLHLEADQADRAAEYADRLARLPDWEAEAKVMLGLARRARLDTASTAKALALALEIDIDNAKQLEGIWPIIEQLHEQDMIGDIKIIRPFSAIPVRQ